MDTIANTAGNWRNRTVTDNENFSYLFVAGGIDDNYDIIVALLEEENENNEPEDHLIVPKKKDIFYLSNTRYDGVKIGYIENGNKDKIVYVSAYYDEHDRSLQFDGVLKGSDITALKVTALRKEAFILAYDVMILKKLEHYDIYRNEYYFKIMIGAPTVYAEFADLYKP